MSSGTRSSLRRSRRAPRRLSDYRVGDVVELSIGNTMVRGHLAQLLTEGSSPNPRWLVKFDGPMKDEEVYEHTFGKVGRVGGGSSSDESRMTNNDSPTSTTTATGATGAKEFHKAKENSKETLEDQALSSSMVVKGGGTSATTTKSTTHTVTSKKSVAFQDNGSSEASLSRETDGAGEKRRIRSTLKASSATSGARGVSAREQRSRRRQATTTKDHVSDAAITTGSKVGGKRRLKQGNKPGHGQFKRAKIASSKNEECVKIKFLTGTLYLYRGEPRRAEFIRRV